jgi:hypothetical protein
MNAYAVFVVNEHLEMLRREAAERRAANEGRPSAIARIAARFAGLRGVLSRTEQPASPVLPRLDGYPYRG